MNDNIHDERHGGPFDRGMADSYYGRPKRPHYFKGGTGTSLEVEPPEMTPAEVEAYHAGYRYNAEVLMDFKNWD